MRDVPDLVWALNEKDIDFADLGDEQFCNHFQGITELTTKRGFCNVLRDMPWSGENPLEVSPRCYNLGDPVHRDEFIDDFRLTAAVSILKWFVMLQLQASEKHSETLRSIQGVIDSCIYACTWKIRIDHHGEWPGVDRSRVFRDQEENFGLTGNQWSEILHKSYKLGERSEQWTGRALQECIFSFKSSNDLKLSLVISVLRHLAKSCPQFYLDGFRNVWVIKAAESSCGIGITLFYRLQDILGSEKGMGGRTVQKYLENPLVRYEIPSQLKVAVDSSTSNSHRGISQIEQSKKFDIRVWVLVLSFNPLVVKIFNKVYGRRCSSKFSLTTTSLSDCWMHLSNYAVQKKKATTNNSGNAAVRKSIIQNNNVVAVSEPKNNKPNTKIFRDISEQGEDYDDRGISEKTSASELASKNRVRRLRQLCTDSRSITEDSGQWQSSTATEDYISKDVDPSLLVGSSSN